MLLSNSKNSFRFVQFATLTFALCSNQAIANSESEKNSENNKNDITSEDSINTDSAVKSLIFDPTLALAEPSSTSPSISLENTDESEKSFWDSDFFEPMRLSLAQEFSYKTAQPDQVVKNRSSFRFEYSEPFLDHFSVQLDAKATAFYYNDQRTESNSDTTVTKAYLQASFHQTSIKVGVQTVAWGESLAAIITDEISPRDNREFANLNLDEVRVGQPMIIVDQYSDFGRWSFLYIPTPEFDKNPAKGSLYDPLQGAFNFQTEDTDKKSEYGASWRNTFGGADISIMAARLIDNQYTLLADNTNPYVLTREAQAYSMAGMTFTYIVKDFLISGELGVKSKKAFTDKFSQKVFNRDRVDSSLGVEYSPTSTFTLMLEAVQQHIVDWNSEISVPEDRHSYMLILTKKLMNEDLAINFFNIYNQPYSSNLAVFIASYKWNDNITLELNATAPETNNNKSDLWFYRDQKQIGFKFQYQF